MSEGKRFSMEIHDIFKFKDGRTVMVGTVEDGPPYIAPGEFEVQADGETIALLRIEGEMISGPGEFSQRPGFRAVSTDLTRCFDREFLKRQRLVLKPRKGISAPGGESLAEACDAPALNRH